MNNCKNKRIFLQIKNGNKNEIYLQEIYQSSNQEMFAISLSSCSRYNANFKLGQSVFAIHDSPLYYEISEDDHPTKLRW
jgi:hypothetical protein